MYGHLMFVHLEYVRETVLGRRCPLRERQHARAATFAAPPSLALGGGAGHGVEEGVLKSLLEFAP